MCAFVYIMPHICAHVFHSKARLSSSLIYLSFALLSAFPVFLEERVTVITTIMRSLGCTVELSATGESKEWDGGVEGSP